MVELLGARPFAEKTTYEEFVEGTGMRTLTHLSSNSVKEDDNIMLQMFKTTFHFGSMSVKVA